MIVWRLLMVAAVILSVVPGGCSGPAAAPVITPTQSPQPIGSGTPLPSPVGSSSAAPTPTPTLTASPTASPSTAPTNALTASLTSIVVCAQAQQTCAVDLDAYASTGEEAVVLVKGANGSLTFSNTGGASVATLTDQVYSSTPTSTEYEVIYKTATASATTDTLTIGESGSNDQLVIPVTIMSPGNDSGPDFFALDTTSGTVCPGNEVTFGTTQEGGATIVLASSSATLLSIAQAGGPNYVLNLLRAGSGYVTASAGSASVIYPVNIPLQGFTPTC